MFGEIRGDVRCIGYLESEIEPLYSAALFL